MLNPTIISLRIAYDCLQEGKSVAPPIRQQLESTLLSGLESSNPQIFKLAAEVKLARRLNNLVRIDEQLAIDNNSYITCAEYQLFLDETGEPCQQPHWQSNTFTAGDATKTITEISWSNANKFCLWLKSWSEKQGLNSKLTESLTFYRLATKDETEQHSIKDDQQFKETGIRLFKFQLPSLYSQLAYYLMNGKWEEADVETALIMLIVMTERSEQPDGFRKFPCEDLRIIDKLWVYASKGQLGFSVQKSIYQRGKGGSKKWSNIVKQLKWYKWYYQNIEDAPKGHLPKIVYNSNIMDLLIREFSSRDGVLEFRSSRSLNKFELNVESLGEGVIRRKVKAIGFWVEANYKEGLVVEWNELIAQRLLDCNI